MACVFFCCGKGLVVFVELGSCVYNSALGPKEQKSPANQLPLGLIFAQLFVGVRLSEFSFGLLSVIFVWAVATGGNVLLSSRVYFFCLALLGLRDFCLAFAVFCFCFSGGRDNFFVGLVGI